VLRPVTFVWEGREVGDEALIVWSAGQERLDRQKRQTLLKRLLNGLQHIQGQLNRRHYRRRDYTQEQIHRVQRGNAAASLVDVELSGTDGNLSLHFRIHRERLAATQVLDGKYVLVSNARHLSADERFTHFKGQEGVEKRLSVVKGPLRVRPTFLHRDERIEVLVWVNLVALLLYALLEKQVREAGLPYTARKVLEGFAGLGASETLFADGSHWRQADPLTVLQAEVVHRLEVPGADFYAGYEPLIVWA
jgi:transposase